MRGNTKITVTDVADRLEQAAQTLRRLPPVKVQGYYNNWPNFVRDCNESYGWNEAHYRMGPPHANDISKMDEALRWLFWLEVEERQLLWARAIGTPWKAICWRFHCGKTKAHQNWTVSLLKIVYRLRERPVSDSFLRKMMRQNLCGESERLLA